MPYVPRRPRPPGVGAPAPCLDDVTVPQEAIDMLEEGLAGRVILKGTPGYEGARTKNSHCPDLACPDIIAECISEDDIRLCLAVAEKFDLRFAPRCGGHSTAGFCVAEDLVIDTSEMNRVEPAPDLRTVCVQAGANLSQVYGVLQGADRHIPGGECATVGVAGHMQGGGYGFTSREFGLNCDVVESVRVMLADGSVVTADAKENDLLYWAVRGGTGCQFGVLLEIVYRIEEIQKLWGISVLWSMDDAPEILDAIQTRFVHGDEWPSQLGYQMAFAFYQDPDDHERPREPVIVLMGMFNGEESEGRRLLDCLFEVAEPKAELYSGTAHYAELNEILIGSFFTEPLPHTAQELKSSAYFADRVGPDGWGEIIEHYLESPNHFNIMAMEMYGGAVSGVEESATAFVHRQVDFDLFTDSFFDTEGELNDRERAEQWLDDMKGVIAKYASGRKYQNYPEPDLGDYDHYMEVYFGGNKGKLEQAKTEYDPDEFFTFAQGIRPG